MFEMIGSAELFVLEVDNKINIINAEKMEENFLKEVTIVQFSNDFKFIKSINPKTIDITNKDLIIFDASIFFIFSLLF